MVMMFNFLFLLWDVCISKITKKFFPRIHSSCWWRPLIIFFSSLFVFLSFLILPSNE